MRRYITKKIALCIIICLALSLVGCGSHVDMSASSDSNESNGFVEVERYTNCLVVYRKETKVMYAVSLSLYNAGNFTLLVNPDGSPMIFEE